MSKRVRNPDLFTLERGHATAQGSRDHQEDNYAFSEEQFTTDGVAIYAVFDGHGNDQYSLHCSKHFIPSFLASDAFQRGNIEQALVDTFHSEDEKMEVALKERDLQKGKIRGGTTATVAVIRNKELYVANVGDSRAILGRLGPDGLEVVRLSKDHKLKDRDEKERVDEAGGRTAGDRIYAEKHSLNMTRALGDYDFKKPQQEEDVVSPHPHLTTRTLSDQDVFLLLATDGLWDEYGDDSIAKRIVKEHLTAKKDVQVIIEETVKGVSKRDMSDNVTAILVFLNWGGVQGATEGQQQSSGKKKKEAKKDDDDSDGAENKTK